MTLLLTKNTIYDTTSLLSKLSTTTQHYFLALFINNTINTIMKTKLITFVALATMILLTSCNKGEERVVSTESKTNTEVGVAHNECLVEILDILQNAPKTKSGDLDLTRSEVNTVISETTLQYVVTKYEIDDEYVPLVKESIDKQIVDINNDEMLAIVEGCSDEEKKLYEELDQIMSDDDINLFSLQNRISRTIVDANKYLTGVALEDFLAAASVANNTLAYWHDNYDNWTTTLNTPITKANSFNWKQLGKADVRGCVEGLAGDLVGYLFASGPVGWKVWVGIAVGSAVASSAGDALDQLW